MKKTFPVNINGSVFYIDEDAYELLNNYLDQLRVAFPGREGEEIVADIEGRIYEIFTEMSNGSSGVITIADVNVVIEKMGRPADISEGETDTAEAETQTFADEGATPPPFDESYQATAPRISKRLFRDMQNKILGGVLSGLAVYMNWNTNILRVLVVILALCTKIYPLFFCYLVAWMVIPPANTMRRILEMRGEPVTVDSVSQSVLDSIASEDASTSGIISNIFRVLFKIVLVFITIFGVCFGIGALVFLITTLCGLIVLAGWGSDSILQSFFYEFDYSSAHPVLYAMGMLAAALAVLVPSVAAVTGCIRGLKGNGRVTTSSIVTIAAVEIVLIIIAIVCVTASNVYHPISLVSTTNMLPLTSSMATCLCSMNIF